MDLSIQIDITPPISHGQVISTTNQRESTTGGEQYSSLSLNIR